MKLINMNINKYFHMIPLWKSPIKLPVELPMKLPVKLPVELPVEFVQTKDAVAAPRVYTNSTGSSTGSFTGSTTGFKYDDSNSTSSSNSHG